MVPTPVSVPLIRYEDALWAVVVDVRGEDRTFLFDTGAGLTCLTPVEAQRLGLEPFGCMTGHRMSGERVDVPRLPALTLGLGGVAIEHTDPGVLDLARFLPPDWGLIGGVVSLASFAAQPITLDLPGRQLVMESAGSLRERTAGMRRLRARVGTAVQGRAPTIWVAVAAESGPLWFELDTGNTGPTIVAPHAAAQLGWADPTDPPDPTAPTEATELEVIGLPRASMSVVVKDVTYDGNFGAAFLDHRVVTIDIRDASVWVSTPDVE